ncbi:fibronectin type III domain-containing protein [Chryseobacterium contaminans]|uniref:Por secretion system C-terminal sorting domain-containing protein n=2 Tax=Chryseobacterium contaminans TaxID=1423959 RepID=A0A1M7AY47_9FLAO|nr:fibronectin type III domain-containing protein [Chryseobacterium contaminans]SHL47645.1 Por secretion system C-terminal sorting domain-containing protein [Chryseobacterium contaminans]
MKKILLSCWALLSMGVYAQTNVASYAFSKSTGVAYVPITGGTKLFPTATSTTFTYDNEVSAAIPLSSPFNFGGVAMTTCYVSANGYITFGAAPSGSNYTPLSTVGSTTGAISAFGQDGGFSASEALPPGNHEVRYEDLGTEFVVQWQDHANYSNRSTERLNFQIRLVYATGEIKIIYGDCTDPGTSTSGSPQVGIRGNSNAFATNVSSLTIGNVPTGSTCDWSKAVTASANNSTLTFSSGTNANIKIPAGLQYSWTPGTLLPVRTFAATTAVTNNGATLSWTAPAGATAYNVQYRTPGSCDWTNYSGNPVSANSVSLTGLQANTTYQVQVQALNGTAQSIYSHIPNLAGTGSGYTTTGSFTTALTCSSIVTGLASSAITPETSTISWTAPATAPGSGYEYYYSTSSTTPALTASPSGSVGAGVTTVNLSGLTPLTQYYYWVRSNCNGTDKGAWSSSANFTTLGLCPTVTAPASNASGVSTTPTIAWNVINGATGYKLKIGTTSGGNDVLDTDITGGTNNSYTLANSLNNSSTYYYSVTAYTATTAGPATACTVRSFQTVCTSTTLPYTLDFDNVTTPALPMCTSVINSGNGNVWKTASAPTGFTGKVLNYPYNSSNAANTWFFTQGLNLTAGVSYRIKYKYANSSGVVYPEKVKVAYGSSATAAEMTNTIADHSNITTNGVPTSTFTDFTPSASGVYYFGFQAYSAADMNQIYIDDINIDITPTCFEPSGVTVSAITATEANISWTAPSLVPGNGYEYYYSTTNLTPNASTAPSGTSTGTSASLSNLLSGTTYYLWVRSSCSPTDKSVWTPVKIFATNCVPVQTYSQNFDNTPVDSLPPCWTSIGSNLGYAKVISYSGTVASASNALYIYTSGTSIGMVSTPDLVGLDSNNAMISFKGRANSNANGTVQIGYLADPASTSSFVVLGTYTATSTSVLDNYSLNITGVPAGVTKLVFKHTGSAAYSLLIDDFTYQLGNLSTSEVANTKNDIKVYPNPFSDVLNIADISKVKTLQIIDGAGRIVKVIESPSAVLQLADLKQGMYLVVLHMKDGTKQTVKVIKR